MRAMGLTGRILAVAACMMTASCDRSEDSGTKVRTAKQALGGCGLFNCGAQTNLTTTAVTSVELKSNVVMIPRSRWNQLIEESSGNLGALQATNEVREQAVRLASIANDPMSSGVFSSEPLGSPEGGSFTIDDILVVVDEAYVDPNTNAVYATDFFISVIGLEGDSPWVRRGLKIAVEPTMMSGGGRCCGPENIGEQLEPTLGDPGTQPPDCTPGPNAYCAGWNTRLRSAGSINHDLRRAQTGRPIITMQMFSLSGQTMRFSFAGPLGGLVAGQIDCTQAVPMCLESIPMNGFPWGGLEALLPHGNSGCSSSSTPGGTNVPPWCTIASGSNYSASGSSVVVVRPAGGGLGMAECDGQCPECSSLDAVSNTGVVPRQCWLRTLPGDICEKDSTALMTQLQSEINARFDYNTMTPCATPQDLTARCGGCQRVGGPSSGAFECGRCTRTATGLVTCDYYQGYENGTAACPAEADLICRPGLMSAPPVGEVQASFQLIGGGPVGAVHDVTLTPELPCTAGCGGATRVGEHMPSTAPRGGAVAETAEGPPKKVNGAELADRKEGENSEVSNDGQQNAGNNQAADGDPVTLFDGALVLNTSDLSFPGPSRPLEFTRSYSSRTNIRSPLGSNWSHNFAVRLIPLKKQNMPAWVDPYCMGTPNVTTCLMLVSGDSSRLFYLDQATGLYMPQAGSMATVRAVSGDIQGSSGTDEVGWVLRQPDGAELTFDLRGYLRRDTDRFGNGFTLEYELTAAGQVLEAVCPQVPFARANGVGGWGPMTGPTGISSQMQGCVLLYGLTGFTDMPSYSATTQVTDAIFGTASSDPVVVAARAAVVASQPTFGTPLPSGQAHMRVKRVTDDLGRTLEFEYGTVAPDIGLLKRVLGPAATIVEFTYASDTNAPAGLNERFLVAAKRVDGNSGQPLIVAAGNRGYEYEYAWQRSDQMPTDLLTADAAYRAYFNHIYNCGGLVKQTCTDKWVNTVQFADTVALAAEQRRRLYAEAADNITTVRVHSYAPATYRIESETRYARDVYHPNFDRALAQRWGGEVDPALPSVQHPPQSFSWQNANLPLATFEYAGAVPKVSNNTVVGDKTDDFLPAALLSRYALEPDLWPSSSVNDSRNKGLLLPPSAPLADPAPFTSDRAPVALASLQILENTVRQPCGYHLLPDARAKLPGYKPSLDYYDTQLPTTDLATPGVSFSQQIRRSYLSCETLALAETYDVRHNDLASTWTKAQNGTFVVESMTGRRKHTAANANRICQWVRYTDRDGDVHYRGLNFQGRPLVNAVRVMEGSTEKWKVAETLYNADGNVLSQRRTTDVAWTPGDGDTRYTYMEAVVPPGSLGTTRPQHWTKRGNVVRVWERPRGGTVSDEVDGTATVVPSLGRFTAYAYEPFYNQVRLVIRGNVNSLGHDEALERTVFFQDWQELAPSSPQLQRLLWMAHLWGGHLSTNAADGTHRDMPTDGGTFEFAWEAVKGQLGVELYTGDMNGDAVQESTLGVPVIIRTEAGFGWGQREDTQLRWSPAGKPYLIDAPGGERTVLEYYARGTAQSGAADLSPGGAINGGNVGFLARVTRARDWPANKGPPRPSCASLPRQYQFLLTSCAQNPQAELAALGLSEEAIKGILNAPAGVVASVNYNVLGHVSGVKSNTGLRSVIKMDTDGRVLQTDVYPAGSAARDSYSQQELDAFKRATRSQRFSNSGQALAETVRTFDNDDRLLTECHASALNGCNPRQIANVKRRWVYTREGAVFRDIDAVGLVTEYTREGRKWVTKKTVTSPNPADPVRQETTTYDDDGNPEITTFGIQSTLSENRSWDGLGRLLSMTDTQQRTVHYKYSKQDVMTSSLLVGDGAGRTMYTHDGFGRTSVVTKNGRTLAVYNRLPGGLPYALSADGRGTRFVTYDAAGQVAWAENSVGDMSVFTERVSPVHEVTSSRIRQQGAWTTGSVAQLDGLGRPQWSREVGGALSRTTHFEYDLAGNLERTIAPDTAQTVAVYDWLGRIKELRQQQAWNASAYEISTYTYNSRGLLESTIDPMGYETVQQYDAFGAPSSRTGPQSVVDSWTYDEHGRKVTHTVGGQIDLGYAYDSYGRLKFVTRGHPQAPGVPELASFSYDALGRVEKAKRRNLGLAPHLAQDERTVQVSRIYDDASRRYTEAVSVGQAPARTVTTEWLFAGTWTRRVELPSGRLQEHRFDTEGREVQQLRASGQESNFVWVDELLEASTSYYSGPGDKVVASTQFDALTQSREVSWSNGNDPLMNVSIVRDNMGRIAGSGISFLGGRTQGTSWRGYVYDALGRVAAVHEGSATPSGIQPHQGTAVTGAEVELAGNSVSAVRWGYTREAKVGGLVAITDGIQRPRFAAPLGFTSPNGTPTSRTDGHRLDKFEVGNSSRQSVHDGAGRLFSDDDQQFIFDDLDALAMVNDPNGNLKEGYLYDAQGRLTARLDHDALLVESIVYDGVQMVESYDSKTLRWSASWGPGIDNLVSLTTREIEYFTLDDGKANIVGWVSSASGLLEAFAEYTPEGRGKYTDDFNGTVCEEIDNVRCAKPFDLPFGFHSAYSSSTTGLVYFRNRWYSPEAAQWLSHDPLGFVDSFNLYAFNAFDSINFFDPMGLASKDLSGWKNDPSVYPDSDSSIGVGLDFTDPPQTPEGGCGAVCKLTELGGRELRQGSSRSNDSTGGGSPGDGIGVPVVPPSGSRRPQLSILPSKLDRMSPRDIARAIKLMTADDLEIVGRHIGNPREMSVAQARAVRDGLLERNVGGEDLTQRQREDYVNKVLLEGYFETTNHQAEEAFNVIGEVSSALLQSQVQGQAAGVVLGGVAKIKVKKYDTPIRNVHLAGKTHPVTGIPFDKKGFPVFDKVMIKEVKIKYTGRRSGDFAAANAKAGLQKTPEGYTWHHHQDGKTMQLVPRDLHSKTGHTGGFCLGE